MEQAEKEYFMREAMKEAQKAAALGEVPIGAVVVRDGKIIGRGYNERETTQDATTHAEMSAIRQANQHIGNWRLEEADLFVTLEPCPMCSGAILLSRVRKVYYGAADLKGGTAGTLMNLLTDGRFNHQAEVERGVLEEECKGMLQSFFRELREKRKQENRKHLRRHAAEFEEQTRQKRKAENRSKMGQQREETAMTIKERVGKDFIQARKDRDTLKADVLRLLKSHFDAFKIDNHRDMDETEEINYLLKEQKQTEEALSFARDAGREDLVQENETKLAILSSYLPQMMGEEEVRSYLVEKGVPDMEMKDAMKLAMSELNGKAEKRLISQVVKELLGK